MSEDEGFLRRWSRRKQAAAERPAQAEPAPPAADALPAQPADSALPEAAVDLSSLPSVESIGPGTDIRAFLQKGVPVDLTRAALRRAWSEDPAIRDFIEVAENQWDFATGTGIPGFGPLDPGVDLQRMVADIMGEVRDGASAPSATDLDRVGQLDSIPPGDETPRGEAIRDAVASSKPESDRQKSSTSVAVAEPARDSALQQAAEHDAARPQVSGRRHGGALPQ